MMKMRWLQFFVLMALLMQLPTCLAGDPSKASVFVDTGTNEALYVKYDSLTYCMTEVWYRSERLKPVRLIIEKSETESDMGRCTHKASFPGDKKNVYLMRLALAQCFPCLESKNPDKTVQEFAYTEFTKEEFFKYRPSRLVIRLAQKPKTYYNPKTGEWLKIVAVDDTFKLYTATNATNTWLTVSNAVWKPRNVLKCQLGSRWYTLQFQFCWLGIHRFEVEKDNSFIALEARNSADETPEQLLWGYFAGSFKNVLAPDIPEPHILKLSKEGGKLIAQLLVENQQPVTLALPTDAWMKNEIKLDFAPRAKFVYTLKFNIPDWCNMGLGYPYITIDQPNGEIKILDMYEEPNTK